MAELDYVTMVDVEQAIDRLAPEVKELVIISRQYLTRRASDEARCFVRAGGLREIDAGGTRLVRKFRLVFMRLLRPFGKGWCRLEQQSGVPQGMPD